MRPSGPEDMGADAAAEEQFGPYLVYERLGVGGMATVHRALERGIEGFERIVALKRLLPHLAADAVFIKSFVREAKLASLLNHVNIVQIFELGRVGTQYFISMEYIEGRDIRRILRHARRASGPPPIHVTVGLLLQLCDALDYAHHKADDSGHPMGLVHRDVSPSNLLVTSGGQVKVIDFGIAKAQSAQLRTQTGRVKGKLAYMAPEALAGKDLDARSDLFAAGVIAHELVTARPLFASKNEYQTLMKLQRGEVMPPSTFNQSCPPELDAIVLRALARDPDDRFSHAGELRDELNAMRKQYNLQTAAHDIASWLDWAFQLEVPGAPAVPPEPPDEVDRRAGQRPHPARPRRSDDDEAIELAWGDHDDHGNGEPIVLDDVPDVSDKHLQHASALGAEVRLDLGDLADDIPTPLPSHGRPTVDLSARATEPRLPRPRVRSKRPSAAPPRRRQPPATPSDGDGRTDTMAAPMAAHAVPAGDDGATLPNAEIAPELRAALVPRTRTITAAPPRVLGAPLAPPRNIAAAALPPRMGPAPAEPSRGVPLPVAASRSGALSAERSRGVPIAMAASRSGSIPAEPSRRGTATEPSQAIPVAIEPSYAGPAPAESSRGVPAARERSRSGMLPVPPARSGPAAIPPPRALPPGSAPPRQRRATSPGTGTAPPDRPGPSADALGARDTLIDITSSDRALALRIEELGTAADTMPAMPAMSATSAAAVEHGTAPVVRFREPSTPPPAPATPAAAEPSPPPAAEPVPRDTLAMVMTTSTHRQRLITPATALFAEPEPDAAAATALSVSSAGFPRASRSAIPDVPPAHRGVSLGRLVVVVVCLALVSAATTAAALYLTRDDGATAPPPTDAPAAGKAVGTVRFDIVPGDAAITIDGKRVHTGAPWLAELHPGVYQIEIVRDGYMGWLTSIDLAAGQSQTVQARLEALGSAVIAEATLIVRSTPDGLDITLDGEPSGRTPRTLTIKAGRHSLALRANGAEVWRKDIDARASAVYEYHPTLARPAEPPAGQTPSRPAPGAEASSAAPAEAAIRKVATGAAAPAPPEAASAATAPTGSPSAAVSSPLPAAARSPASQSAAPSPAASPSPAAVPPTASQSAAPSPAASPPAPAAVPPTASQSAAPSPAASPPAPAAVPPAATRE